MRFLDSHIISSDYLQKQSQQQRLFLWPLILLLVFCTGESRADEKGERDVRAWLQKMADAADQNNYNGTFVYHRGDQLIGMHVVHVSDSNGIRERLSTLTGRPREVIRMCANGVCVAPGRNRLLVAKRRLHQVFSKDARNKVDSLEKYYHFRVKMRDRIAGRLTRMITIEPRDAYRYGYHLWLDEKNGLMLKSDLIDPAEHHVLEQLMYTAVEFVDHPTEEMLRLVDIGNFKEQNRSKTEVQEEEATKPMNEANSNWSVGSIPEGFLQTEYYRHPKLNKQRAFEHMVLSDGLASVSVFFEDVEPKNKQPFTGFSEMGAVNAYGRIIEKHQVVIVGEVPQSTVAMIGDSIRCKKKENGVEAK